MSIFKLRDFESDNTLDETTLYTFDSQKNSVLLANVSEIEKTIIMALNKENPNIIEDLTNVTTEDISDPIFTDCMITSELPESNTIMTLSFIKGTDVISAKNSADLEYHKQTQNSTVQQSKKNTMKLGPDNAPLYVGNLKLDFIDGDSTYHSDIDTHYISLNPNDVDYNYFKAVNSELSNLANNSENGIRGGFDNTFNSTDAFFTEKIISRVVNNKLISGNPYGYDGISKSDNSVKTSLYNKLDVNILDITGNTNKPLFGSLKFVQDELVVNVNNTSDTSTMSVLLNTTDTITIPIATQRPPTSINETEFKNLFNNLDKVGPGYTFDLVIGKSQQGGGYDIDNDKNKIIIPSYDDTNTLSYPSTNPLPLPMFNMDDTMIKENLRYMREMQSNDLFNQHKFLVKNGTFEKDSTQSTNLNFSDFVVRDGVETLQVFSLDENDLTKSGVISVSNSNNNLGDVNCRFVRKSTDVDMSLVVNYANNEPDYLPAVGIISNDLETNYIVKSNITALAKSTLTTDTTLWNTKFDVAKNDDCVLVFQSDPDHPLFEKANISEFKAAGLSTHIGSDKFALINITKEFDIINSSDESPLFKTVNNSTISGVTSNIRLTDINLNSFKADDLRVTLICKQKSNIPVINKSSDDINVWEWFTASSDSSKLTFNGTNFIDDNDAYLISNKNGKTLLGPDIYKMMNTDTANTAKKLNLQIKFFTNTEEVENRDILERGANINLILDGNLINKTIPVDESDIHFQDISEITSVATSMNLTDLTGLEGTDISRFRVDKFVTTKEYYACIKVKIGAYKNLWAVHRVYEDTIWYQLTDNNQNKIMPDYYLRKITKMANSKNVQAFKTKRVFKDKNGQEVTTLSATSSFSVKDLMGFISGVEYRTKNFSDQFVWTPFNLIIDTVYGGSLDPMFDLRTQVSFKLSPLSASLGSATIAIDTSITTTLGLKDHVISGSNSMYIINLSTAIGKTTFKAVGYTYNIASDSKYFNRTKTWDPYSVGNALFLKNDIMETNAGTLMNLSVDVTLIDPAPLDPLDTSNVNEINKVKVRIINTIDNMELASFISDKWILENFNIIANKHPIVQHDYCVSRLESSTFSTEYLHSTKTDPNSSKFYAKLLYGSPYNGVRVEFPIAILRNNYSNFELKGDRLYMSPLVNSKDVHNSYAGRYNNNEEIMSSSTGYPLPTNSLVHRNIHPTKFRGYKNGQQPINILRTSTTIKMVIGDKFQDDMNLNYNSSNISNVWKNRGIEGVYEQLEAKDIRSVTNVEPSPDNLNVVANTQGISIGELGLKLVPNYSMFPVTIESKHEIPIKVTPANYTKTITNPLDTSIETTVNGNLFDVVLHDFVTYDIVATRIKVYNDFENFNFKYVIPDLKVFHSPQYVGDVRTNINWTHINTYTDAQLRTGDVIRDIRDNTVTGVVNFKRSLTFVSNHTKYCTLPRPIAFLEAYGITDFNNVILPFDLSSFLRKKYWVDINIDLEKKDQKHLPFKQDPPQTIPNNSNLINKTLGLMDELQLGFNETNYLKFRANKNNFSFTLTSNKLTIYNGIGLSSPHNSLYTKVFDGYISELNKDSNWNEELKYKINNIFTSKKWNLNTRQLHNNIFNYIVPTPLLNNYLFVEGIPSYPLGTYYLDLNLSDSVVATYYSMDRSFNSTTKNIDVSFHRYTSVAGLNWATSEQFNRSENFRPMIVNKQKYTLPVTIPNTLTEKKFDINELIKLEVAKQIKSKSLTWTQESNYVPAPSPVRICPLSINGSKFLLSTLQVNGDFPLKIIGFNRPPIILIKSADGASVTRITPDGILSTVKLSTTLIQLLPNIDVDIGQSSTLNTELFAGNINPLI